MDSSWYVVPRLDTEQRTNLATQATRRSSAISRWLKSISLALARPIQPSWNRMLFSLEFPALSVPPPQTSITRTRDRVRFDTTFRDYNASMPINDL